PIGGISNLYGIQLNAEQTFEDFKQQYKKEVDDAFDEKLKAQGGNRDVVFDRKVIMESIDLTPQSFDEVMALTHIMDLMTEGHYDRFVLD
ncbi:hypothetical protein MYX04_15255, partial [Nitrospiraceae bacterium AH_259_D15_M11_P09]|nr:hypothetical protein [Nitrospiraceae bacterium AH_259_D15_M11_P09]